MKLIALLLLSQTLFAGTKISSFSLPQMNNKGVIYNSLDHAGAVFVLETYFQKCPYCNENAPNVDALAKSYGHTPQVQVLDIGVDKKDSSYETWIATHQPNHPVLKDAERTLVKQLGTTGYPTVYVIDCHGEVAYEYAGVWEAQEIQEIKDTVQSLLEGTCKK